MQEFLAGLCRYDQGARLSDALNQWERMSDPVEAALADSVVMKHVAQREFGTAAITKVTPRMPPPLGVGRNRN